MYCGALGKRGNWQIGISVHLVSDRASSAANWRLFIPESWDDARAGDDRPWRKQSAAAGGGPVSPTGFAIARNGAWPSMPLTRRVQAGSCRTCRWSRTPDTGMPPASARA
jgi:hypothetical protein